MARRRYKPGVRDEDAGTSSKNSAQAFLMQFEKVVRTLTDAEGDFIGIAGISATYQRSSRTCANLPRLPIASVRFHPRAGGIDLTLFTLQTGIGEIDMLAESPGGHAIEDVKKLSRPVEAFRPHIATFSLLGLIRNKQAAGLEQDLSAVTELESLREAGEE